MFENIYNTIPEGLLNKDDEDRLVKMVDFLMSNCDKVFSAKAIAKEIGLPAKDTSVRTRRLIAIAVEVGYPIVSMQKGYFFTDNPRAIELNIERNNQRIKGIERRNAALLHTKHKLESQQYEGDELL